MQNGSFQATAFECNESLEAIEPAVRKSGTTIRVCIAPTEITSSRDVYMMKINSLRFVKEDSADISQVAVASGAESEDGRSVVLCNAGAPVCSIQTRLQDIFFEEDGKVLGSGEVSLQYGDGSVRALRVGSKAEQQNHRRAQKFAAFTNVLMEFEVDDGKSEREESISNSKNFIVDHWTDSDTHVKVLYAVMLFVMLLICICFCGGICCWEWYLRDPKDSVLRRHFGRGPPESEEFDDMYYDDDKDYDPNQEEESYYEEEDMDDQRGQGNYASDDNDDNEYDDDSDIDVSKQGDDSASHGEEILE